MSNKKKKKRLAAGTNATEESAKKRRNKLVIIVAVLLAVLIIFGVIMMILGIVRDNNTAMKIGNIYLDKGVASYLASTYKGYHLDDIDGEFEDARDSYAFWSSPYSSEMTQGEYLAKRTEEFIKQVLVGAHLFDTLYGDLTSSDKKVISNSCSQVVDYIAGSKARFNALGKKMGFDYDDFKEATELWYKADIAQKSIFGEAGSNIAAGYYPTELAEFFDTYSYVKVLVIRTEDKPKIDENGELLRDENNEIVYEQMSAEEKAEHSDLIARIRADLNDGELDSFDIDSLLASVNKDYNNHDGHYFATGSAAAASFARDENENVVLTALTMDIGSYAEVTSLDCVYFIYRDEHTSVNAYTDSTYEADFTDFFSDAADYIYGKMLESGMDEVAVKKLYYDIDLVKLAVNEDLVINSWG